MRGRGPENRQQIEADGRGQAHPRRVGSAESRMLLQVAHPLYAAVAFAHFGVPDGYVAPA